MSGKQTLHEVGRIVWAGTDTQADSPSVAWLLGITLREPLAGEAVYAAYLRLSMQKLSPEDHLYGLMRQYEACVELAQTNGGCIGAVYCDVSKSADTRKGKRLAWEALFANLTTFDGLVGGAFRRVTRDPETVALLCPTYEANKGLRFLVPEQDYDLSTLRGRERAYGTAHAGLNELAEMSDLQTKRYAQMRERGKVWGPRAFGWEDCKVRDADGFIPWRTGEALALQEAAQDLIAGKSLCSITRQWEAAGLISSKDKRITTNRLREWLESPRIVGWVVQRKDDLPRTHWFFVSKKTGKPVRSEAKPILDEPTWFAVNEVLAVKKDAYEASIRVRPTRAAKYRYTSLGVCLKCKERMHGMVRPERRGGYQYTCQKHCTTIDGPALDAHLDAMLQGRWANAPVLPVEYKPYPREDEYVRALRKIAEMEAGYDDDTIPYDRFMRITGEQDKKLAVLRPERDAWLQAQASLQPTGAIADWEAAVARKDEEAVRLMARREIAYFEVSAGTRGRKLFDSSRVKVKWRETAVPALANAQPDAVVSPQPPGPGSPLVVPVQGSTAVRRLA